MAKVPLVVTVCLTIAAGAALRAGQGPRGGVPVGADGECPAGTTEIRPGNCAAPSQPPPSIVDYRPKSTLVTPAHLVPKAKFPVVDIHGHPGELYTEDRIARVVAAMDALNLGVMVVAEALTGERLTRTLAALEKSPHKHRFRVFCGIDLRGVGPGWAERAVTQLEADVAAGAVGVGEISKAFGLSIQKADGTRLTIDDPELDPVWQAAARLDIPVFLHTADPQAFFDRHDYYNERWLELALFPGRAGTASRGVTFDELAAERDRLFARHPKTRFIAAHFGWHANDLARASKMLDASPNVMTEVGAILYDLGRQPRAAHDFFVKYQDRILFGRTRSSRPNIPTTGACSRPATSTSTTTGTTTPSGSCTGWPCPTRC
jgi:hypothetical protein